VGVRVKIRLDLQKRIRMLQRSILRGSCDVLKFEIIDNILSGISPVKGQKRFAKYTPRYKSAIRKGKVRSRGERVRGKSISPVNLKATGTLLNSLTCKVQGDRIKIAFTDFVAEFHNVTGPAGRKDKIRRMLPTKKGEEFNISIQITLSKMLDRLVKRTTKR